MRPNKILGKPLNYSAANKLRAHRQIAALVNQMTAITEQAIQALFAEDGAPGTGQDEAFTGKAKRTIEGLTSRFSNLFNLGADQISDSMTADADKQSATALQGSLGAMADALTIRASLLTPAVKDTISAAAAESASLIKSIGKQYLDGVSSALFRSITTGNGLQDLVPYLQQQKGITDRRARFIAADQTRKAYSSINSQRMQALGVKKFKWMHSAGGQHPRLLHKDVLNGNIYSFDDLPVIDERTNERGIPGQLPNCKCFMAPVVTFDDDDDDNSTN